MHITKTTALLLTLALPSTVLLAQTQQDPFTINIKKEGGEAHAADSGEGKVDDRVSQANDEGAAAEDGSSSLTEDDTQVGVVVEESEDGGGVIVEGVEDVGSSSGEEELEVVEEGAETGNVSQDEEWTTVEIPQIKGSIKIPAGWHLPTAEQVLKAVDFLEFDDDEQRANAEMGALAVGRMTFLVTKNPEPTEEVNPGLSVTWEPMPLVFEQVPLEARSAGLARVLSTVAIPELKSKDEGFQLLEGPKAIDDEGGGAWVTFRATHPLKSGKTNESIVRLYVLPARDHIITAQITAPADREEGEEVLPDLWAIFESLSYAK